MPMNVVARHLDRSRRDWEWIGLALLLPMAGAVLVTAVWTEIGQVLFGLAGLNCAACADPSNGIDTVGAVGGLFGAGTAAGGAAAGTGETGGVGGGRDDRTVWYPTGPESFPDEESRRNWYDQHFGPGPGPVHQTIIDTTIFVGETVEKWAQEWIDPDRRWFFDEKGTAPASKA
jgi:hypothetical protein